MAAWYVVGAVCVCLFAFGTGTDAVTEKKLNELREGLDLLERLLEESDLEDSSREVQQRKMPPTKQQRQEPSGDTVKRLLNTRELQQHFEVLHDADNDDQAFDLDLVRGRQIITVTSGDAEGSKMVIDETQGIISWANTETDECYLIGGVDPSLPSTEQLGEELNEGDKDAVFGGQMLYHKVGGAMVQSPGLLAAEVQPFCRGKSIYWLAKATQLDVNDGAGVKRRVRGGRTRCRPYRFCLMLLEHQYKQKYGSARSLE